MVKALLLHPRRNIERLAKLRKRPSQLSKRVTNIVTQQAALLTDGTYIELPCNAAPSSPIMRRCTEIEKAPFELLDETLAWMAEHHSSWFRAPNARWFTIDITLKQQRRSALPSAGASSTSGAYAVQTHEERSDQEAPMASLPSASASAFASASSDQQVIPAYGLPHTGLSTQVPVSTIAASASIPTHPDGAAMSRLLDPHHRAADSRDPAEAARKAALRVQRQSLVSSPAFVALEDREDIALVQKLILAQGLATSVSVLPGPTWLSYDGHEEGFVDLILYDGAQTVFLCCLYRNHRLCETKREMVQQLAEWARYIHSADEATRDLSSGANLVHGMRVAPIFVIPRVYGKAWGRSNKKVMQQCKERQVSLFTENPGALHVAEPWPPRKSSGRNDSTYARRKESVQTRTGQADARSNVHQLGSRRQPHQCAKFPAMSEKMVYQRHCL